MIVAVLERKSDGRRWRVEFEDISVTSASKHLASGVTIFTVKRDGWTAEDSWDSGRDPAHNWPVWGDSDTEPEEYEVVDVRAE